MEVATKFELGERGWHVEIVRTSAQPNCTLCGNERSVKIEGKKNTYPCPRCMPGGRRRMVQSRRYMARSSGKVKEIMLAITKRTTTVSYYAADNWLEENDIFKTKEEAERLAVKKNRKVAKSL